MTSFSFLICDWHLEYETVVGRNQNDDSSHLPSLYGSSQGSVSLAFNKRRNNRHIAIITPTDTVTVKRTDWRNRLEADFVVTRTDSALFALPTSSALTADNSSRKQEEARKKEEKETLNQLVLSKAKQEALQSFLSTCRRFAATALKASKASSMKRLARSFDWCCKALWWCDWG